MFASSKSKTRRIAPSYEEWVPHDYQDRAVEFLLDNPIAALFLDPGLGKTSITLQAFCTLQEEGVVSKMLVVAPLRVCQLVWEQEAKKWTQFRHLKFSLLHGGNKKKCLNDKSDIHLINPEGVAWLMKQHKGKLPYDIMCLDELTKWKNSQSVRFKAAFPKAQRMPWKWGLTGTPIPNGYLDLFGQMKILDGGQSLGFYYSHYRDKYFEKDFTGFNYELRRGADKAIEAAVKPYVLRMDADDYLELPPLVDDIREIVLDPKSRKIYNELKKEMIVELEGNTVEAGNAAAVYSKLKQMANGAVYAGDGIFEPKQTIHIHDLKLDALEELVDELAGTPLIVAYEFNHDLDRLKKRFGRSAPHLGSGVSGAKARKIERDWNENKLPLLFAHPASAGHGLNFQRGNACHICWFSVTWDYELYDQFIKRILRQGNKALRILNHILLVDGTIDNKTRDAILDKGLRQDAFNNALNAEIYHDGKTDAPPHRGTQTKETIMVKKLSRRSSRREELDEEEEEDVVETRKRAPRASSGRRSSRRDVEEDEGEEEELDDDEEEKAPRRSSVRSTKRKLRGRADEDDDDSEEEDDGEGEEESSRPKARFSKAVNARRKKSSVPVEEEEDEEADEEEEVEKTQASSPDHAAPTAPAVKKVASKALEQVDRLLDDDQNTPEEVCSLIHSLSTLSYLLSN